MFFLKKKHRCNNSSRDYVECDDFGWWLTGSKPHTQTCDHAITSDGISVAGSTHSVISCTGVDNDNSFVLVQESSGVLRNGNFHAREKYVAPFHEKTIDDDHDEICSAEEPPCKTSSRSYTPERLVRTEDYAILTSSPNYFSASQTETSSPDIATPCKLCPNKPHRRLNHLIDQQLVGASQLEALLDPNALDIKLAVAVARRNVFADDFLNEESKCSSDILAIANSESPKRLLTPDLMSSGSSCERLNCVSNHCDHSCSLAISENRSSPSHREFDDLRNSADDILRQDISTEKSWRSDLLTETSDDPETVVEKLRGRIERIRDINRNIFDDLSSLKKNFQWAEKKTGNLTTETTRLRREIRDLRYLDDLVNLLRGELERISERNWPFNLGHADHHTEEVNLVV